MARSKQQRLVQDRVWELIEPLIPPRPAPRGPGGRPRIDDRAALEGILFVLDTGCRWRDLPEQFGPWQTGGKRHRRLAGDGTWDQVLAVLLAGADAAGKLGWQVSVDSTVNRAHQHGTNLTRAEHGTGGILESQESADRAS